MRRAGKDSTFPLKIMTVSIDSEHENYDSEHENYDSEHENYDSEHENYDSEHENYDSEHSQGIINYTKIISPRLLETQCMNQSGDNK